MREDTTKIIHDIQKKYLSFHTYTDSGLITRGYSGEAAENKYTFFTYFKRPNYFAFQVTKFDASMKGLYYSVQAGCDGEKSYFAQFNEGARSSVEIEVNLGMALAALIGLSCGVVNIVPNLLLPSVNHRHPFELIGIAEVAPEGSDAYELVGKFPGGVDRFRVNKSTNLITSYFQKTESGEDDVIYREISTDIELPEVVFKIPS